MKPFNNCLTKHLYRIDEVLSSLRWSIITHNITDTAFWTIELFQSGLVQECTELLETIWVYHIGLSSWFALKLVLFIYENGEIPMDDLLSITCAFARSRHTDSTVFHLLLRGATTNWKPSFPHSAEYQTIEEAVTDCLRRGKLQEAWLLGRSMEQDQHWLLLEKIATELGRAEELTTLKELREVRYESLAAAYVLVALTPEKWLKSQEPFENVIPPEVKQAMAQWLSEKSLRKRRPIKPKPEALIYLTARSEQTPYISSEPDIQDGLLVNLQKSEYWAPILEHYMTGFSQGSRWKSSRHKELFYDTFFPDDIPDEWSVKSREMSHGRGLGKTKEQARQRFIHCTLQRSKSLELWNSIFPTTLDCSMDWDDLYSVRPTFTFPMKPIKKVFALS